MNARGLLDQLMTGAKDLYAKGENAAADRLGVGDDPRGRETMRNAALGGAAATAVLGLLLGTKTGRSLAKTGVIAGGLGYLGKIAYDAYANRASGAATAAAGEDAPVGALEGPALDRRAQALLAAMIAAAKADGHIDATERQMIESKLDEMGAGARAALAAELDKPIDPVAIAALADGDQARREIYAMSALVCGGEHAMERAYLDGLARALALPGDVAQEIEKGLARA